MDIEEIWKGGIEQTEKRRDFVPLERISQKTFQKTPEDFSYSKMIRKIANPMGRESLSRRKNKTYQ